MIKPIVVIGTCLFVLLSFQSSYSTDTDERPNILWLVSEDNSPFLGCYGDKNAITPNLDKLADKGITYDNAFANAPVCAPMRNSIITGVFASTTGCQNMRSKNPLPKHIKFFPEYLREAGYYCTNNAKEDYNTINTSTIWDESSRNAHYNNRKEGQPFFAIFNTNLSHEHKIHYTSLIDKDKLQHDPTEMVLAPYHPDLSEIRQCYANYYDYVTRMDAWIGEKLKEIEDNDLSENTIVFYYSDHGGVLPRSKRFIYESGTKIPFIIRFPEKYKHLAPGISGSREDRLISLVDLAPTMLNLTGIQIPGYMSGKAFLGAQKVKKPEYVHFFRQRMDERYDMMRAVRDKKFRYIRNYMPHRKYGLHLAYLWRSTATRAWEEAYYGGECNDIQARFWGYKEPEELYAIDTDPHNVNNLAHDSEYMSVLKRMRDETKRWVRENKDAGFLPEGMMTDRAGENTIFSLTHDPKFPMERIIETAEMASMRDGKHLAELIKRLSDDEPAVRYWAATGCAILGEEAKMALLKLKVLLKDPFADIRITSAEALCKMGYKEESLDLLVAEMKNKNPSIQLHALNVLDALEEDTKAVLNDIMSGVPGRIETDNYFHRAHTQLIKKLKPGWEDYISW